MARRMRDPSDLMLRFSLIAVCFALLAGAPPFAGGQNLAIDQRDPVFRADTREVVLHVTVLDKNDQLVTNLSREDFLVSEDNETKQIKYFRREDVPVSVGILVDNSGSMRDKRRQVNTAAVEFVKASNPEDEVFIVNFNDEAYLDMDFTNDIDRMQDALQRIDSRGGTALYDAIDVSLAHLRKKAKHDKRILLIISDGEDNASQGTDLETLVRSLQEQDSQTAIYAIGLLSEEEKRSAKRAERSLRHMARASGGPAYFPDSADEVGELTQQIALDIRNQYTIAYSPAEDKPPGFRRIQIEMADRKNRKLSVRHRPGYFAQ